LWPGDDTLPRDPALWTAQGFDVVMPQPADMYRLVADQEATLARLVASAHAMADAPIWVVGPGPVIDAALAAPQFGHGVSGVVMTSVASGGSSCSESFFYSDPGTGAPPKVEVKRSGDCGTGSPAITGRQPSVLPAKSAAPHRGIVGREEFAASRKGAAPRRADQISASWVKGTGPALAASAGPVFGDESSMMGKQAEVRTGSRSRLEQAEVDSHSRLGRVQADSHSRSAPAQADSRSLGHKLPAAVAAS
jgi:hypothetical protein